MGDRCIDCDRNVPHIEEIDCRFRPDGLTVLGAEKLRAELDEKEKHAEIGRQNFRLILKERDALRVELEKVKADNAATLRVAAERAWLRAHDEDVVRRCLRAFGPASGPPGAVEMFVREVLGPKPTVDDIQRVTEEAGVLAGLEVDIAYKDESVTPNVAHTLRVTWYKGVLKIRRPQPGVYQAKYVTKLNFVFQRTTTDLLGAAIPGAPADGFGAYYREAVLS